MVLALLLAGFCSFTVKALELAQNGNLLEMTNGDVRIEYNLDTGRANFYWQNLMKVSGFYAGVDLGPNYVTDTVYPTHSWSVSSNTVTVTSTTSAWPTMIQTFIFDQTDSFLTSMSLTASTNLQSNWMSPFVVDTQGFLNIGITNDNRALFVPFDNDDFVSYNSEPMNGSDTGYEVGAFYDNVSRIGLVIGSVTHDKWKTGIWWSGSNNEITQMHAFGGVTGFWTWDVAPHGMVNGMTITSPVIFVGFGNDWRTTMEDFAAENKLYAPMLAWTNGVPFGWNSWGVTNYQSHITYNAAIAVSDSIHTNLQPYGFTNNGTVYVNLDSYGTYNLNTSQLISFVKHCHANGQKAGIYFTPFTYWGTASQGSNNIATGSSYYWSDLYLRTTNGSPISYDGAIALDPTHPGTKDWIYNQITSFISEGFDYVKIDFLSHGSLEGVHYDPNVTTGIEAYNEGMQFLLNEVGGTMFISESIAPLFPYQYAHSRRIACDAYGSKIAKTLYTMNSVTYGWWLDKLYSFNDPDLMVFDNGPGANEDQSRLINCTITGVYLNGSILTNSSSVATAQLYLTNAAINAVARVGRTFRPVDGATGTGAGNIFVRQDGGTWCLAVFNYTGSASNETVNLSSAGLPPETFVATNLWDGTTVLATNTLRVSLNADQAKLFRLALTNAPQPRFISITSGGDWTMIFSGSNGIPGLQYFVAATTNPALPVAQWPLVTTNCFDTNGGFNFTLSQRPDALQQFYLLETP
jgi:alpha-galactosidase